MGFPRALRHPGPRAACGGASQAARLVRKNPQFQPHILFSSRRKENMPLTVQEKRAAGGAVPLWRTPPDPPAERAANGCFFTPQVFAVAPACGAGLPGLLGRQGSGGFLPSWGGPPARFGDFPAVESHAGVRGRSAPKLSAGALGPRWRSAPGKLASTAYIETHRQAKSGLDGTFDRAKVPKARWGVSMRPRPLTTPLGDPEGPRRRASPAR